MANSGADSSDQEDNKKKEEGKQLVGNTCAACKHWERTCNEGECEFAQHFPADRMEDFKAVQRVFKISKVRKMLKGTADTIRGGEVAKSLIWEANCWISDPVHGPLGYHNSLCDQVRLLENQISNRDLQIQLLTDLVITQQQQQQRQQQPVLLPLFPSGGDGNGIRMGGHHHQDHHHMTIQENYGGMIMPRLRHDDQDGVHRAAGGGGDHHQHGRQPYRQRTDINATTTFLDQNMGEQIIFQEEAGRGAGSRNSGS